MKYIYLITFLFANFFAGATHYRAAEISSRLLEPLKLEVTVTTYAKWSYPSNLADRDTIRVQWGDGNSSVLFRVNGPDLGAPGMPGPNGIPDGELIENDMHLNVYRGIHTYAALPVSGSYVISFADLNRMDGINNITNSVNVPMYVQHTVNIAAMYSTGSTHSPVFTVPAMQFGNVNDTLLYNPGTYDADGDGLLFSLVTPMQDSAMQILDYRTLSDVCPSTLFEINANTGDVTWITACQYGIYSIAI